MKKILKDGKCWCEHMHNSIHMNAMKISTNLKSTNKKFNNHIKKSIALEMKHSRKFTKKNLDQHHHIYYLTQLRSGPLPPTLHMYKTNSPKDRNLFLTYNSHSAIYIHIYKYCTLQWLSLFFLLATRLQNYMILLTNGLKARSVQKLHQNFVLNLQIKAGTHEP